MEVFLTWCSAGPLVLMAMLSPFGYGMKEAHYVLPVLPLFILLNCDIFEIYHHYCPSTIKSAGTEPVQEQKQVEERQKTSKILINLM